MSEMQNFPAVFSNADALQARNKLGINQTQFWAPLGVTQSCASRYESGRDIPRPVQLLLALRYGGAQVKRKALRVMGMKEAG